MKWFEINKISLFNHLFDIQKRLLKLKNKDWILYCVSHGGICNGTLNKYSDIDKWNSELFIQQTSTMIDLTGILMYSDLEKIKPILTDQSFRKTDMSIAAPIDISN